MATVLGIAVGAGIGVISAVYAYDRLVPPPRCDDTIVTGRRFVHPMCLSTSAPLEATIPAAMMGALLVVSALWFYRSRRSASDDAGR